MPFTPFHFGHALPFSFLDWKKNRIDLPSALLASVIIDARATYVYLFHLNAPFHGILHNFFMATLLGILVGLLMQVTQIWWNPLLKKIDLEQHSSLIGKVAIALLMAWIHVFLDATIYPEMIPLWPFQSGNLFFGMLSSSQAYAICIYGFFIACVQVIGYYFYRSLRKQPQSDMELKQQEDYQQDFLSFSETNASN
ncbi:hypothetical protein [Candidatus Harpocratesius sp.]